MAKSLERIRARGLRSEGKSIKAIAKVLGVSPGSVSIWCRDVKLSPQQIKKLERDYRDPFYGSRLANVIRQQQDRIAKTERLRTEGIGQVGAVSTRELFLVGAALYWAEGYKKDSQAGLGSSDPAMMKLFVKWLSDCFGYTTDDLLFRVTFNISHQYREREIVNFWASQFGIRASEFQKPFYQKAKWKKIYENQDAYFGVLRIKVRRSKDFLRKVNGFIEGLRRVVLDSCD